MKKIILSIILSLTVLNAQKFNEEQIDYLITEIAQNYSKQTPIRINESTVLQEVFANTEQDTLNIIKIMTYENEKLLLEQLSKAYLIIRENLIFAEANIVCKNETQLRTLINNKVEVNYVYATAQRLPVFNFTLDKNYCLNKDKRAFKN